MSHYIIDNKILFSSQSGKMYNLESDKHDQLRSNEWKLLQLFLNNIGDDLSTDDILKSVWDSKRARSSVATSIKNLRALLNDSAESPRYIQTQVMSGYAFIGTVRIIDAYEFEHYLTIRSTLKTKLTKWGRANLSTCFLYLLNVLSVIIIVCSVTHLYQQRDDSHYFGASSDISYIPMIIHGDASGFANSYDVCQNLLMKAKHDTLFTTLLTSPEPQQIQYPSLSWSNSHKEVLICHLSPIE